MSFFWNNDATKNILRGELVSLRSTYKLSNQAWWMLCVHRIQLWSSVGGRCPCPREAVLPGSILEDTGSTSWLRTPNRLPKRRWSSSWLRQSPVSDSRIITNIKTLCHYISAWWNLLLSDSVVDRARRTGWHRVCEKVHRQKQASAWRPCRVSITRQQADVCRGVKSMSLIFIPAFK